MHVHLRTGTEVHELVNRNVKKVYKVCRCGDRKLIRTLSSATASGMTYADLKTTHRVFANGDILPLG